MMFATGSAVAMALGAASSLKEIAAFVNGILRKRRTSRRSKKNCEVLRSRVDDLVENLRSLAATEPSSAAGVRRLLQTLERAEALVASRRQGRNCLRRFWGGREDLKKIDDMNRQIDNDILSLILCKLMMADNQEGEGKGIYTAPRCPGPIPDSPHVMQAVDMRIAISILTFKAGAAYEAAKVMSGKGDEFESVISDVKFIRDTLSSLQERDLALDLPSDHWGDMVTSIKSVLEGVHRLVRLHKRKGTKLMRCCFGGIGLLDETRKVKEEINRALLRLSYYRQPIPIALHPASGHPS